MEILIKNIHKVAKDAQVQASKEFISHQNQQVAKLISIVYPD